MKRILALLLVLCMLFSLAACAAEDEDDRRDRVSSSDRDDDDDDDDDDKDKDDRDDEPDLDNDGLPYKMGENGRVLDDYFKGVEIEWWISSNYRLYSDMYLFQKLEEVIGCEIKVVSYDSETYSVKVNTALQTNSLPNMCYLPVPHSVYNVYGDYGAFVDLLDESTLVRMPNLRNKILGDTNLANQLKPYQSENGALYSLPKYNCNRLVNHGWMFREDIFEKHGIEMWHDTESFLEVCRQLKQLYPNSYPVGGSDMQAMFDRVCSSYGFNSTTMAYDWNTNRWYLGAANEGFYEMMSLFQTMYHEGLLDPDCFTNGVNNMHEGAFYNVSFIYNAGIDEMAVANTYAKNNPDMLDPNFHMAYAPHIGNGMGQELPELEVTGTVINARADVKQVEACIAIYNYLYSDEGAQIMTMGEEGVTYRIENGERVYLNRDGSAMDNPSIRNLEEQHGLWNSANVVLATREAPYFTYTPEEADAQMIGAQKGLLKGVPAVTIDQDSATRYENLSVMLNNEIRQYCQKFIKDGYTRADWEEQCTSWNIMYAELFDILNGTH